MEKSMSEHLDGVIKDLKVIVNNRPFHAFALLAITIEVLGKCLNSNPDWHHFEPKGADFNNALLNYESLKKYTELSGHLYKSLRCGMVHALMPTREIRLIPDRNDFSKNTVGCKELYEDIVTAWNAIKEGEIMPSKDMSEKLIEVQGQSTGITSESKTE